VPKTSHNGRDFDLADYLPYLLNRAASRMTFFADALFREHGINLQGWRVLAALLHDDGQRMGELAASTSIELSTLSRLVDSLAVGRLVEKRRAHPSARSVSAHLTPRGRGLAERIVPSALETERIALDGLSPREIAALKDTLRHIFQNVADLEPDAGPAMKIMSSPGRRQGLRPRT
jgi:DNA-binding MarR family transcriptional regulator